MLFKICFDCVLDLLCNRLRVFSLYGLGGIFDWLHNPQGGLGGIFD